MAAEALANPNPPEVSKSDPVSRDAKLLLALVRMV
jgi:hypothetical protein